MDVASRAWLVAKYDLIAAGAVAGVATRAARLTQGVMRVPQDPFSTPRRALSDPSDPLQIGNAP
jgi:hypothetical protein